MICIGDKVLTERGNEIAVGVVRDIYNFERGDLYIVDIGGELFKRREGEIHLIPEKKPKPKPDEIMLTREELRGKFMATLDPTLYDTDDPSVHISIYVSGLMILEKLEKELFGGK